jgi:hypothetical protein
VIEIDDVRAVDAQKWWIRQAVLEAADAQADQVALALRVDHDVVVLRLDALDIGEQHGQDGIAVAHEDAVEGCLGNRGKGRAGSIERGAAAAHLDDVAGPLQRREESAGAERLQAPSRK